MERLAQQSVSGSCKPLLLWMGQNGGNCPFEHLCAWSVDGRKGNLLFGKESKIQEEGVFHDTFYPGCDRHFDLVQVLQFYCGKSKSFFRHQSGDESADRSSWNFFHHVYSDILSCGCLSWRCRGGKPFGCIFISFFFPESDFRTDRTVERFSETYGTPQGR